MKAFSYLMFLMLTNCAAFGYVKIDYLEEHTDIQACRFSVDKNSAKCVKIETFVEQYEKALKEANGNTTLTQFNMTWNSNQNCVETTYGQYCEEAN